MSSPIEILSDKEMVGMRKACRLASKMLEHLGTFVEAGISTLELDNEAVAFAKKHHAKNAPFGYHGFPKSICTSINEVVCHGIPNKKDVLKKGDIINVDVSPIVDGFYGDTSKTFIVGNTTPVAKDLVKVTYECMWEGIKQVAPGQRVGDIGHAIQQYAEKRGFSVVRDFVGHGIGKVFHYPDFQIPHYGKAGTGKRLVEGMTFTIEPMINEGVWQVKILDDGWTAITRDKKLSAQFEHTVLVTKDGVEVLTLREDETSRL